MQGDGTREHPWQLKTPSGSSEYQMYKDESANPPVLVCTVGKTELRYQLRCLDDLHAMLKAHGDWMPLGSADEQKEAAEGTVEAWGRSPKNPVGGWYGLKKGLRGRFGMYIPPLMEALTWPKWSTIPGTTACGRCRLNDNKNNGTAYRHSFIFIVSPIMTMNLS